MLPRNYEVAMLAPQLVAERRKRIRRIWIAVSIFVVAVAALAFAAKPIYSTIKRWRAERLAANAETFISQEKWNDALQSAQAAYQLTPDDPPVIRAIAQLQSRIGRAGAAIPFWKQLGNSMTPADRRNLAEDLLRTGESSEAEQIIAALMRDYPDDAATQLAAARLDIVRRHDEQSLVAAQRALQLDPNNIDARLFIASLHLQSQDAATRATGFQEMTALAHDPSKAGLTALIILSQQNALSKKDVAELIPLLKQHPLAREEHQLLALGWELRTAEPGKREALLDAAVAAHQSVDANAKHTFASWLNARREYKRTLSLLPQSEAMQRKDLFLVYLDALAGLKRWDEIAQILEKADAPLDEAYKELFLARSAMEQGKISAADLHWRRAHLAAASSPEQTLYVGNYAERIGQTDQAEIAYRSLTSNAAAARPAYEGLLRLAMRKGDIASEVALLDEMETHWPNDPSVQNDRAYLNLLQYQKLAESLQTAQQLVARFPGSLPHRTTLALACLRFHDAVAALGVYAGLNIDWDQQATPGQRAVHAAALAMAGIMNEARAEAEKIRLDALLPGERELLRETVGI